MRKLAEKIAIVAQICIALVFVLTTLVYTLNIFPQGEYNVEGGVLTAVLIVLGVAYVLLSGFLLYENFSNTENLKRIMLYCDSESATLTSVKVVGNIVKDCAKTAGGISVKKVKLKTDENNGLTLTLKVNVSADVVSKPVDTMRCLLADSFAKILGITFNSINFQVVKLKSGYYPSISKAKEQAEAIAEYREQDIERYNDPIPQQDDDTAERISRLQDEDENDSATE